MLRKNIKFETKIKTNLRTFKLTKSGPGMSFLQTSSNGTPNLTFSNLLGYGPGGWPHDVTTLLKVAALLCILAAQLLISFTNTNTCRGLQFSTTALADDYPTITLKRVDFRSQSLLSTSMTNGIIIIENYNQAADVH